MKSIILGFAVVAIGMVGCAHKDVTEVPSDLCDPSELYVQAVINNHLYRNEIREDYKSCLAANTNRDVTYNDTNELAKTCLESAHKLNGGIYASFTTVDQSYISKIEAALRKCGTIK